MDRFWSTDAELSPAALSMLMEARQTMLPKRLDGPGPDADEWRAWLSSAASAPDHRQVLPWRFVCVPKSQRHRLGDCFAQALLERDPSATDEQMSQAREKAMRAPVLLLLVVDAARGDPDIDLLERVVSAGCAVQNMLLMATAQGYGSALTSGKALKSKALHTLFGLTPNEHALCFISLGNVRQRRPARSRPSPEDYLQTLGETGIVAGFPPAPDTSE
jgi:nitroreductase